METEIKLKSCPFCGGVAEMTMAYHLFDKPTFRVICRDCGASGEITHDDEKAVRTWNRRCETSLIFEAAEAAILHDRFYSKSLETSPATRRKRKGKAMNEKTIYIAGQMAGLPDLNFPAFYAAEKRLEAAGWKPVNPARFNHVFGVEPKGRLLDAVCESERAAIPHLDAIYLLKGWEKSKGAKRELLVALQHGLEVIVEGAEP